MTLNTAMPPTSQVFFPDAYLPFYVFVSETVMKACGAGLS
jgi:hypothetical protein